MIKTEKYVSKKEYEKAAKKMMKKGWEVVSVDVKKERPMSCCFPLLGFLAFLSTDVYYVTYRI